MGLGEKLRKYRNYLDLTLEEFGKIVGVKKAHLSDIENERNGKSASLDLLSKIIEEYEIDARYFFEQLDDPKEADLRNRENKLYSPSEELAKEVRELKNVYIPHTGSDALTDRINANAQLRELVEMIQFWEGGMLRRFKDMAYAYFAGSRNESEKSHHIKHSESKKGESLAV